MLKSIFNDKQSPSILLRVLVFIIASVFLIVGLTEIIVPAGWDRIFGVPLKSSDGLSFVQAVGARNMGISLIAIIGALAGNRGAIFLALVALCFIAAVDCYIVKSAGLTTAYIKHGVFVVALTLAAVWTAISGMSKTRE